MKKPHSLLPAEALSRARAMRGQLTRSELILWARLRDRKLGGFKFRRQSPKPPYIADFYCAEAKLVIEVDGPSHGDAESYDASRTATLERDGLAVIRVQNDDVLRATDGVLKTILRECESRTGKTHCSSPGTPGEAG